MTVDELQRIKKWHVANYRDHPVEYHLWDIVLMTWLMGWVGWVPAYAFGSIWSIPICLFGMSAPSLYVAWRAKAHRARKLRCDWLRA
jgi:hypothetical protein